MESDEELSAVGTTETPALKPEHQRKTASLQTSVAQQYTSFIGVEFNACVSGNMLIEWQLREYSYLPGR
jgi:hypothetical protein